MVSRESNRASPVGGDVMQKTSDLTIEVGDLLYAPADIWDSCWVRCAIVTDVDATSGEFTEIKVIGLIDGSDGYFDYSLSQESIAIDEVMSWNHDGPTALRGTERGIFIVDSEGRLRDAE